MKSENRLYKSAMNPFLIKTERTLPRAAAVIGAGTIGPDIGYYLKSAMPDITLYLVDIDEKPLQMLKSGWRDTPRKRWIAKR